MTKYSAIYSRVSSAQVEGGRGRAHPRQEESLGKQKELLSAWFAKLELPGAPKFFEDDQSGSEENRPGLMRLVQAIERGEVDSLLIYDDSRLARHQWLANALYSLCWQHRVRLYIFSWGREADWDRAEDRMALGINSLTNEFFLTNLRRLSKDGSERLLAKGCWVARAPYGYVRGADKKLAPDGARFEAVKRVFSEIRDKGVRLIAQGLEADRILNKVPAYSGDTPWTTHAVLRILSNPAYRGDVVWNRRKKGKALPKSDWKTVHDAHPAAVSSADFAAARAVTRERWKGNRFTKKSMNPLAGLLECGHHGRNLIGVRRNGKDEYNLQCDILLCPNSDVPASRIEAAIVSSADSMDRHRDRLRLEGEETRRLALNERAKVQREIEGLNRQISRERERQVEMTMQFARADVTRETLDRELDLAKNSIADLGGRIGRLAVRGMELDQRAACSDSIATSLGMPPNEFLVQVPDMRRRAYRRLLKRAILFERFRIEVVFADEGA